MPTQQTNRAALFALLNPEVEDFITLCGDTRDLASLDDSKIQEIEEALVVSSYKEFEQRFKPKLYTFWDANSQTAQYQRRKPAGIPDDLISEIQLGISNPTTGMLFTMLDSHGNSGAINVHFDHESILEQISPKKTRDSIQQIRKELNYNYQKFQALPPGDPVRDEHAHTLNKLMVQTRAYYKNPTQMLALLIDDSERRLLLGEGEAEEAAKNEKIVAGVMKFAEDGTLKILEAPKPDEKALALTEGESSKALVAVLEKDYEKTVKEDEQSDFVKDIIVRTFSPLTVQQQADVDLEAEAAKYNTYLSIYTQSQAAFIEAAKPIIQHMIGIYTFFQQYPVKGKSGMLPKLLVTNCDPELLARSSNIVRLETYLASVNNTNDYDKTIWMGIIPNLSFKSVEEVEVVDEVFETVNKEKKNTDIVSMAVLSTLISTLAEYQVKAFFSYETGEDSTFDKLKREGLQPFIDRVDNLMEKENSAYAVPCLPNITVIPKNKSGVVTGKFMESDGTHIGLSDAQESIQRFWINGIYVPAAYPAAGIYAAMQCPEALRIWFNRDVDPELPGVRVDIEAGNNANLILTTLAREISGYPQSVKDEINRQRFGFIFGSENTVFRGRKISKLTVYTARSLASDGYSFEPIFQTQVTDYFERVMRQATGDNKDQNVKFFFSSNPTSQMSQWRKKENMVNAIVQPDDEVSFDLDETGTNCDINFTFGGVSKNVRVKLNRATAKAG